MAAKPFLTLAGLMLLAAPATAQNSPEELWDTEGAIIPDPVHIEIRDQVRIAAEVPGRIVLLDPAHVGDIVKAGQVIIKLDDSVQQAQLNVLEVKAEDVAAIEAAEDELAIAKIEVKDKKDRNKKSPGAFTETEIRRLELDEKRAGSRLKKAKHDRLVAQAEVEAKRVELEQYTVKTSLGGKVESLNFHSIGSSVRQGDPIIEIVNLDKVKAILTVNQDQYERVQIGDLVLLRKKNSSGGLQDDGGNGGGLFKTSAKKKPQLSAFRPTAKQDVVTFVGRVTHFKNDAKTDDDNSFQVVAVIENKMSGPGKHMLREGVRVQARIIPGN